MSEKFSKSTYTRELNYTEKELKELKQLFTEEEIKELVYQRTHRQACYDIIINNPLHNPTVKE